MSLLSLPPLLPLPLALSTSRLSDSHFYDASLFTRLPKILSPFSRSNPIRIPTSRPGNGDYSMNRFIELSEFRFNFFKMDRVRCGVLPGYKAKICSGYVTGATSYTELGYKLGPRFRELAPLQRETGGGIHTTL